MAVDWITMGTELRKEQDALTRELAFMACDLFDCVEDEPMLNEYVALDDAELLAFSTKWNARGMRGRVKRESYWREKIAGLRGHGRCLMWPDKPWEREPFTV